MINFKINQFGNLQEVKLERLPFVCQKSYSQFIFSEFPKSTYFLIEGEFNGQEFFFPFTVKHSRIIKVGQMLFQPLSATGTKFKKDEEQEVLNEWLAFVRQKKLVDKIIQPPNWCLFQSYPDNSIWAPFGSYRVDLSQDEESINKGLHSKHRNVIKTANKKGAEIRTGRNELDTFFILYKQTMERSQMFCEPKSYFEGLYEKLGEQRLLCAAVYNCDNVPLGAVFIPFTKYAAFYVYGASANRINLTGAINFLHYEIIKLLKGLGVKEYDFVGARLSDTSGTKLEGIQKFKKRFGGKLVEGYLWKADLSPLKCKLYDLLTMLNFKLRGMSTNGDIIDQEIAKLTNEK